MDKKELEFVISNNKYLVGGTKEACVKIRQVLRCIDETEIRVNAECVDTKEFISAIEILMSYAFRKPDEIPETWYCENDCNMVSYLLCPGECNLRDNSSKRCPFYVDESYI